MPILRIPAFYLRAGFGAKIIAGPTLAIGFEEQSLLYRVRQTRDGGVSGPGKTRTSVLDRHAACHRGVAVEHLGGERSFAHLREGFAEGIVARVQQIANPPRPRALAPQGELQRSAPFLQVWFAAELNAYRREVKRPDGNLRWCGHETSLDTSHEWHASVFSRGLSITGEWLSKADAFT